MNIRLIRYRRRRDRFFHFYWITLFTLLTIGLGTAMLFTFFTLPTWHVSSVPVQSSVASSVSRGGSASHLSIAQQSVNLPASASMGVLSSTLLAYLSPFGSNVGVEVYDVTHKRFYTYSNTKQFLTGSSIKVPIMLAFFAQTESQGREPDGDEMDLLTTMIENSNNDSASTLYVDIDGAAGLTHYLQHIGVSGLVPDNDAWGDSQITPQAMVTLLTRLHDGTILTARDRATALNLMQNVETDQQWGVGDTAPGGATFAMKDGWLPDSDGLWTVSTSGIVTTGGETYILSVYTQEQPSLAQGQGILQHVCSAVAVSLR